MLLAYATNGRPDFDAVVGGAVIRGEDYDIQGRARSSRGPSCPYSSAGFPSLGVINTVWAVVTTLLNVGSTPVVASGACSPLVETARPGDRTNQQP